MEYEYRKVKTLSLILVWTSMGLYGEIGGPTMLDLRIRFHANSEDIARSISANGIGIFVGAVISGLFVDTLGAWKFLIVTIAQLLSTITIVSMPFVRSLALLWLMFFCLGTSAGAVNVAGQRLLIEMWKEGTPAPMHALHMGFGIGALLAPLIANPFLAILQFADDNTNATHNTAGQSDCNDDSFIILKESRVHWAYVAIGLLSAVISLPFFIYPVIKCYSKRQLLQYYNMDEEKPTNTLSNIQKFLTMLNPATSARGSWKFGLFVYITIFLYFINLVGGEQLFGNFVRTFSVDELKFSRDEASYLDTVYWGSFTMGRFTGSIVSHFIAISKLLVLDVSLNLVAVTCLVFFVSDSKSCLWAFTAVVGFLIAPIYPAGVAYTNTQLEIGGVVLIIVVFATGFGSMFYIWVTGVLYQTYGPKTILFSIQTSAVLVFLIALMFVYGTFCRGRRLGIPTHEELVVHKPMEDSSIEMNYAKEVVTIP